MNSFARLLLMPEFIYSKTKIQVPAIRLSNPTAVIILSCSLMMKLTLLRPRSADKLVKKLGELLLIY